MTGKAKKHQRALLIGLIVICLDHGWHSLSIVPVNAIQNKASGILIYPAGAGQPNGAEAG